MWQACHHSAGLRPSAPRHTNCTHVKNNRCLWQFSVRMLSSGTLGDHHFAVHLHYVLTFCFGPHKTASGPQKTMSQWRRICTPQVARRKWATPPPPPPCSGVTNTPRGGVVHCTQVKFLGIPFRSQRTLGAHPPHWGLVYSAAAGALHPRVARLVAASGRLFLTSPEYRMCERWHQLQLLCMDTPPCTIWHGPV